jgi:hypothetical protein
MHGTTDQEAATTVDSCIKPRDGPRAVQDAFEERVDGLLREIAEDASRALWEARPGDPARAEGYLGRMTRRAEVVRDVLGVVGQVEATLHAQLRGLGRVRDPVDPGEGDDDGAEA